MWIDGLKRSSMVQTGASVRRSNGARFSVPEFDLQPRVATAAPTMATGNIAVLLALQAVEDSLSSRRRSVRRGRSVLDILEALKADLLAGQVQPERLDALIDLLADLRQRSQPGLDAVLAEIDQRARVELAKLGRFPP